MCWWSKKREIVVLALYPDVFGNKKGTDLFLPWTYLDYPSPAWTPAQVHENTRARAIPKTQGNLENVHLPVPRKRPGRPFVIEFRSRAPRPNRATSPLLLRCHSRSAVSRYPYPFLFPFFCVSRISFFSLLHTRQFESALVTQQLYSLPLNAYKVDK